MDRTDGPLGRRRPALAVLRVGLTLLALGDGATGGWALVWPTSFYSDYPGRRWGWVAAAPPYNEHLITDFGGALLGVAVGLGLAAIIGRRQVAMVVLTVALVQSVPHLLFHLLHPEMLPSGSTTLSIVVLASPVVLASVLLMLASRPATCPQRPSDRGAAAPEERSVRRCGEAAQARPQQRP